MFFLEESLQEAKDLPPLGTRVTNLFTWVWQFASSSRPTYTKTKDDSPLLHNGDSAADYGEDEDSDEASHGALPTLLPHNDVELSKKVIFCRDTICILASFMIFQIANISYNSLYPIFGAAQPPIGRSLSPEEIGVTIGFAGGVTILFQVGIFGKLREKMGNRVTYRACMGIMVLAYLLTPWVGYKDARNGDGGMSSGKKWLYVELCIVLLIRAVGAVGCLTSALLLVSTSHFQNYRDISRLTVSI